MRAVSVVSATAVACFLSYCVTSSFAEADNPPAGSPAADGGAPAEGGAGDGATTESTPHYLTPQAEEATFAKVRAEREAEIADAQHAHEKAVEALTKMKQALVKYSEARKRAEAADAGALRDEVNKEINAIVTEAIALYPSFDVTSRDAGIESDETPSFKSAIDALEPKAKAAETKLAEARAAKKTAEKEIDDLKTNSGSLRLRFRAARLARCKTAWCFGGDDGTEYAFEPALDLPFGASVSVGEGALARYHNTTDFTFQFTAGIRFWMLHDYVSFSLLFARVIYSTTDKISVPGSAMEHSTGDIRRLGPTFALGLFGDLVFVGVGYDQLRNGRGDTRDPAYAPDQVLSRSVTFSLGFAPFTAIRNVAGASK